MSSGERWRLGHRPALDGLRGIAILLVVVSHLGVKRLEPLGATGVTVFFALSGFLITALLLQERSDTGRTRFGSFYARRALRLGPAFVVCICVVIVLERWQYGSAPLAWVPFVEISNWISATQGAGRLLMLHHTWSLSIEEQFYLVWPAVLVVASRLAGRRGVIVAASVGIVASMVTAQFVSGPRLSFGTDTNASSLLIGCLLAAVLIGQRTVTAPAWSLPLGLVLVALGAHPPVGWAPFVPAGTALMIWAVCASRGSALAWSPLRFAGKVSYAWYLWNYPLTLLALNLGIRLWVVPVASLGVAVVSWYAIERPIIRYGRARTSMIAPPTLVPPAYIVHVPSGNARHAHL